MVNHEPPLTRRWIGFVVTGAVLEVGTAVEYRAALRVVADICALSPASHLAGPLAVPTGFVMVD